MPASAARYDDYDVEDCASRVLSSLGLVYCCPALQPRYRRLIDRIYPSSPQEGIVKANMDKLMFYALTSPEKLDRIGEYFFEKVCRDIQRRRIDFVIISLEAMNELLEACHAQTLNIFAESYLKLIKTLLEYNEPALQILASQSFVKFADIREDIPCYHRKYGFLIYNFSVLCLHYQEDIHLRSEVRIAGVKGLQAVIRKIICDDLAKNLWKKCYMDQMIPAILCNMKSAECKNDDIIPFCEESPELIRASEMCMRELAGRTAFEHISLVLKPLLHHLDRNDLWMPNEFSIHTFRLIMSSMPGHYSHVVVETLVLHLNKNSMSSPKTRIGVADVLSKIISIAADECIGPSALETINSLLHHLKVSVMREALLDDPEHLAEEVEYQNKILSALGEYAHHLPHYQKIEIMVFIINKLPGTTFDDISSGEAMLQSILLKSLLEVGAKYCAVNFNVTFPPRFLEPLLLLSVVSYAGIRLLVQKIFHVLLDRHDNLEYLLKPTVKVTELHITWDCCSQLDKIFIRKNGPYIYQHLYESLHQANNTKENIEAVYTTLSLICIELLTEDVISEMMLLLISVQEIAMNSAVLNRIHKCYLHSIVLCVIILISYVVPVPSLFKYSEKIMHARCKHGSHFLPDFMETVSCSDDCPTPSNVNPDILVDHEQIVKCLEESHIDVVRLKEFLSFHTSGTIPNIRHSWANTGMWNMGEKSDDVEMGSIYSLPDSQEKIEVDTFSVGVQTKFVADYNQGFNWVTREPSWHFLEEQSHSSGDDDSSLTREENSDAFPKVRLKFEDIKHAMNESPNIRKKADEERRMYLNNLFRTASFMDLVDITKRKQGCLEDKLNEILNKE